ncbi:hypothetical protein Btru_004569 [Bulinus truncatus]|nr:hypothetical protein Btru_004569 [Bulinus truncatus]
MLCRATTEGDLVIVYVPLIARKLRKRRAYLPAGRFSIGQLRLSRDGTFSPLPVAMGDQGDCIISLVDRGAIISPSFFFVFGYQKVQSSGYDVRSLLEKMRYNTSFMLTFISVATFIAQPIVSQIWTYQPIGEGWQSDGPVDPEEENADYRFVSYQTEAQPDTLVIAAVQQSLSGRFAPVSPASSQTWHTYMGRRNDNG